jgi:hypothetical protein
MLLLLTGASLADIYQHVDANGVTVLSDSPPYRGAIPVLRARGAAGRNAGMPVEQAPLPPQVEEPPLSEPIVIFDAPRLDSSSGGAPTVRSPFAKDLPSPGVPPVLSVTQPLGGQLTAERALPVGNVEASTNPVPEPGKSFKYQD